MLYHIKSEQVSPARRITRTSIVFVITLLGAFLIHRLWFAHSALAFWERVFDALVAAGAFFIFDSQRREYEIEVTDEIISMRGGLLLGAHKVRRGPEGEERFPCRAHKVIACHGRVKFTVI
jgi:hypothetical protein